MTATLHDTQHRDVTQREMLGWGSTEHGYDGYRALAVGVLRSGRNVQGFLSPRNKRFRFWCEAADIDPDVAAALIAKRRQETDECQD
jgi:hypothetical protein